MVEIQHPLELFVLKNGTRIVGQVKDRGPNNIGVQIVQIVYGLEMMNGINPMTGNPYFLLIEFIPEKLSGTSEIILKEEDILISTGASQHLIDYYKKCVNTINNSTIASIDEVVENNVEVNEDQGQDFSNIREGQNLEEFLRSLPVAPKDKMN